MLKDYLKNYDVSDETNNNYLYISPLLPIITQLYDKIELEMKDAYLMNNPKGGMSIVLFFRKTIPSLSLLSSVSITFSDKVTI